MNQEDERRVREIVREELSHFLGEADQGAPEPTEGEGDTSTVRGLLRHLFNVAGRRHQDSMVSTGIDET